MNAATTPGHDPLISVGIPVRNGENFLEVALESLRHQTVENWEALIADNASDDATAEIARTFAHQDPRFRYVRHDRNLGAAPNYNYCFHYTTGPFFKWLAHDDVCDPRYLEATLQALKADDDAVLAYSLAETIDHRGALLETPDPHPGLASKDVIERLQGIVDAERIDESVFGLMRRSAVDMTRLHGSYTGSDRTFMVELAVQGSFAFVPETLHAFREHSGRSTRAFVNSTTPHPRETWFDTSRAGKVVFPNWRRTAAFFTGIAHSPLSGRERLQGHALIVRWLVQGNWKRLAHDVRVAGRTIPQRLHPGSRTAS